MRRRGLPGAASGHPRCSTTMASDAARYPPPRRVRRPGRAGGGYRTRGGRARHIHDAGAAPAVALPELPRGLLRRTRCAGQTMRLRAQAGRDSATASNDEVAQSKKASARLGVAPNRVCDNAPKGRPGAGAWRVGGTAVFLGRASSVAYAGTMSTRVAAPYRRQRGAHAPTAGRTPLMPRTCNAACGRRAVLCRPGLPRRGGRVVRAWISAFCAVRACIRACRTGKPSKIRCAPPATYGGARLNSNFCPLEAPLCVMAAGLAGMGLQNGSLLLYSS